MNRTTYRRIAIACSIVGLLIVGALLAMSLADRAGYRERAPYAPAVTPSPYPTPNWPIWPSKETR